MLLSYILFCLHDVKCLIDESCVRRRNHDILIIILPDLGRVEFSWTRNINPERLGKTWVKCFRGNFNHYRKLPATSVYFLISIDQLILIDSFSLPGRVWKKFTGIIQGRRWKEELEFRELNVSSTTYSSAHLFDSNFNTIIMLDYYFE